MNCPACESTLQMTERSGIEVDYCPKCRGVWLDRGELDKIIERASPADLERSRDRDGEDRVAREYREDREGRYDPRSGRPRKGFLREMFDFD